MTREKNFLEQLDHKEVAYMFQKKNEHDIQKMNKGFEDEFKFEERTKSVSPEKKTHKSLGQRTESPDFKKENKFIHPGISNESHLTEH